jgi:hypothetical protein
MNVFFFEISSYFYKFGFHRGGKLFALHLNNEKIALSIGRAKLVKTGFNQ